MQLAPAHCQKLLLAVQTGAASVPAMQILPIIALLLTTPQAPIPLSEVHLGDIACVVEVAILADQQRRGIWTGPDLRMDGKRWAGMVGARIVRESGQPRELVAFAMTEAAKERAGHVMVNDTGSACLRQMSAELAVADAANRPLPKPQKAQ
jgi:hypothetical protein